MLRGVSRNLVDPGFVHLLSKAVLTRQMKELQGDQTLTLEGVIQLGSDVLKELPG